MASVHHQRKNGIENASKIFAASRVNPEETRSVRDLAASTAESLNNAERVSSIMGRRR